MRIIRTPRPAKQEGPTSCHMKNKLRVTSKGIVQITVKYWKNSWKEKQQPSGEYKKDILRHNQFWSHKKVSKSNWPGFSGHPLKANSPLDQLSWLFSLNLKVLEPAKTKTADTCRPMKTTANLQGFDLCLHAYLSVHGRIDDCSCSRSSSKNEEQEVVDQDAVQETVQKHRDWNKDPFPQKRIAALNVRDQQAAKAKTFVAKRVWSERHLSFNKAFIVWLSCFYAQWWSVNPHEYLPPHQKHPFQQNTMQAASDFRKPTLEAEGWQTLQEQRSVGIKSQKLVLIPRSGTRTKSSSCAFEAFLPSYKNKSVENRKVKRDGGQGPQDVCDKQNRIFRKSKVLSDLLCAVLLSWV